MDRSTQQGELAMMISMLIGGVKEGEEGQKAGGKGNDRLDLDALGWLRR